MAGSDILSGTLDLVILSMVSAEPLHGYGIGKAIEERSSGVLAISESVLYPALHRLERKKQLRSEWGLTDTGRKAKFYRITSRGLKNLSLRSVEWREKSRAATTILRSAL